MRLPLIGTAVLVGLLAVRVPARAGLYYSGETFAELPSQWRGFLLDQRTLRMVATKAGGTAPAVPARARYEEEPARLAAAARQRPLSADEAADLGALYVRLGEVGKALEVLRPAQRTHPVHFRLTANLGTAWQLHGDLAQAAACLRQAVRLAPGKVQRAEELHLRLVRLRGRELRGAQELDDLFGVRFVGPDGRYEPGRLAPEERKRLPSDAVAQVQQLALWLPADGRLLWQLAELAAAHGDVATAAAMLDGCVLEFDLRHPDLRAHRQALRAASRKQARPLDRSAHEDHAALFKPRSSRPLVHRLDQAALPAVDPRGVNVLPWAVIAETTVDHRYRPTFPRYLQELDGKQVELSGYMQPLGEEQEDLAAFLLIENPVGCWYCEMPEATGIVLVELPPDQTHPYTRAPVRVTGRLQLNATDPENFLYIIRQARVADRE